MISNNKGISLVESMIAVFLTVVAIMSLMPMQDMSLRTALRSDYLGRAAGIMQTELEAQESYIMRGSNPVVLGATQKTIHVSDEVDVEGDAVFDVTTTINNNPAAAIAGISWLVNVQVTWTGNNNGIRSSIIVTRQSGFE
jgi:Tfp pilus assembly protein PilV